MKYSIDTSALLDGWRRYYSPDVIPGFWDGLDELISNGSLRATIEVLFELERKDDEVLRWAKQRKILFIPIDVSIQLAVREILKNHKKLIDTRTNRSGADPFVIALAKINNCTVVTGESHTKSPKRPNIPDVCDALGICCLNLVELMREEGWKFKNFK